MSLIVARKDPTSVFVVSDTHLSYVDIKAVAVGQIRHPSTGVIKTVIVNNDICISFAGGEVYADEAFRRIQPETPLSSIKSILLQTHLDSRQETDFVIAVGSPEPHIYEVKNSCCLEVNMAWIGSKRAFTSFQEFMQGTVKSNARNYVRIERVLEEAETESFSMMSSAMDYVIENDKVPEVDGFRVGVAFTEGKFQYTGYTHSYFSDQPMIIDIPEGVDYLSFPITHGTAENGGYLINFFRSSNPRYAGIHILQGKFGIIYERKGGGLMRPMIVTNMDEVDFIDYAEDNFDISPSMLTQSRESKYLVAGEELLKKGDFRGALEWYDKALLRCEGKDRAIFYYNKAIAYANLSQVQDVVHMLDEAIKSDSSYQKKAFSLMGEMQRRRRRP